MGAKGGRVFIDTDPKRILTDQMHGSNKSIFHFFINLFQNLFSPVFYRLANCLIPSILYHSTSYHITLSHYTEFIRELTENVVQIKRTSQIRT